MEKFREQRDLSMEGGWQGKADTAKLESELAALTAKLDAIGSAGEGLTEKQAQLKEIGEGEVASKRLQEEGDTLLPEAIKELKREIAEGHAAAKEMRAEARAEIERDRQTKEKESQPDFIGPDRPPVLGGASGGSPIEVNITQNINSTDPKGAADESAAATTAALEGLTNEGAQVQGQPVQA